MNNDVVMPNAVRTLESRDISEFAELASDNFAPLHMETGRGRDFRGRIRGRQLGDTDVFDVRATQHHVVRGEHIAQRTPKQKYMLHLQMRGVGVIEQDGREAVLHPGDLAFYDSDKPYSLHLDDEFRNAILVFPQRLLALPAGVAQQFTAITITGDAAVSDMVASMFRGLAVNMGTLPRHSCARVSHGIVDLLVSALHRASGVTDDDASHFSGVSMREILAYIEDHLSDPELGPEQVAAANFVAVRTLHAYFRKAGTTTAAWIRSRRLELCREDLADPELDHLPVSAIMTRRGFVSLAHFSRLFKSVFGEAPTEFRRRSFEERQATPALETAHHLQ